MSPRVETPSAGNNAPSAPPRRAVCPRCGYDLRGHVETWTDRCPLDGTCPECGYAFEWADVLSPSREKLAWLYEHAPSLWRPGAAVRTWGRSVLPRRFWRRLRPHHAVVPHRLLLWPFILCALVTLVITPISVAADVISSGVFRAAGHGVPLAQTWRQVSHDAMSVIFLFRWTPTGMGGFEPHPPRTILSAAAFAFVVWLVLTLSPSVWTGSRIRRAHLLRVGVYLLAPIPLLLAAHLVIDAWWSLFKLESALSMSAAHTSPALLSSIHHPPRWLHDSVRAHREAPLMLAVFAWQTLFLHRALRLGLLLPRPRALAIRLSAIGALAAALAGIGAWYRYLPPLH